MSDKELIQEIEGLSISDLLMLILDSPFYLTDSYYSEIGRAIANRGHKLIQGNEEND